MTEPKIGILTRELETANRLTAAFDGAMQVVRYDKPELVVSYVLKDQPQALILDFRVPSRGGHLEDRIIESILAGLPSCQLAILTAEPCPETIERRIACHALDRFKEPVDWDRLLTFLHTATGSSVAAPPKTSTTPRTFEHSPLRESAELSVLEGMTRRFETNTPRMRQMLSELEIAASHDVTILLIGETGSGKTFLSRLIHEISPRRNHPFLPVACGALPSELIESEMFGHVKGAFTSAHADKDGKFLAAGQGSILLDEIDVLELEQQVKLLRVIETGDFEPVGSNHTMRSQARLVVASNLELEPLVEEGRFRPDLYYRLNMLKFEVLPLRKRQPDIIPLADKFLRQLSDKHKIQIQRVDESFYEALLNYPWPGNVRELENVIQRSVIYCRDGELTPKHLPQHIVLGQAGPANDAGVNLNSGRLTRSQALSPRLGMQIALTEQEIIQQALSKNNQSRTHAARQLGISRVTLYNKMKKYGIKKGK
ncbi:sigma-54 interaction domain-containing protein [Lacunimicrobium album]